MKKEELKIVYKHFIPEELITSFKKLELDKHLEVEIVLEKEDEETYNFTGPEISDIIIYVQQHTTELIAGGLLVNAAYDTLKGGLKLLWTGLIKLASQKEQKKGEEKDLSRSISVRLKNKDKEVEIILGGNVSEEQADKIIDEGFKFINSEQLDNAYKNPDFRPSQSETPSVTLLYNKEKDIWEPENFGDYRREMAEFQRRAEDEFNG